MHFIGKIKELHHLLTEEKSHLFIFYLLLIPSFEKQKIKNFLKKYYTPGLNEPKEQFITTKSSLFWIAGGR